jgi:hypothetical protein
MCEYKYERGAYISFIIGDTELSGIIVDRLYVLVLDLKKSSVLRIQKDKHGRAVEIKEYLMSTQEVICNETDDDTKYNLGDEYDYILNSYLSPNIGEELACMMNDCTFEWAEKSISTNIIQIKNKYRIIGQQINNKKSLEDICQDHTQGEIFCIDECDITRII